MSWLVRMIVWMIVMVVMFFDRFLVREMHIELRRRDAAAVNACQAQRVALNTKFGQLALQKFEVESAVEQRSDEHIATRACKTV